MTGNICSALIFIFSLTNVLGMMLFPKSSVLQLTSSVSIPIKDLPMYENGFLDWGIQMNYMLPFDLESYYNVPIWNGSVGRSFDRRQRPDRSLSNASSQWQLSVLEIYKEIEYLLERNHIDKSCLLQYICDFSLNPFNDEDNFLVDILAWILKPSLNGVLAKHHNTVIYENAELFGSKGCNCSAIYGNCQHDLLKFLTKY